MAERESNDPEAAPSEDGEMGRRGKSRIKAGRHKWRPPGHNCPQCGQFPGAHAGVKTQRENGAWGQESQQRQHFKVFVGGQVPKDRLEMSNKVKFALYLPPEKKSELEYRYREEGCRSITAFIEKAIDFYLGYLDANSASAFLPKEIQSAIDGRLGMFEDRMAKLLYKLTVEMDMGMTAALDCIDLDASYLRRLRANSVRNVKATNGLLTFEQKVRDYGDDDEGDEPWQG